VGLFAGRCKSKPYKLRKLSDASLTTCVDLRSVYGGFDVELTLRLVAAKIVEAMKYIFVG